MKFLSFLAATLLAFASAMAEDPSTFSVGAFTFTRPADWGWVAVNSPMRKAQLAVKTKDVETPADVVFYFFGENSGDVQSNVKRWFGQFKSAAGAEKVETNEVGKTKVTIVSTEGTFSSGMPGGPTTPVENAALLGAILENAGGSVFVKMTGPAGVVKLKRDQFVEMVTNAAKLLK